VHRTIEPDDAQLATYEYDYRHYGEAPIGSATLLLDPQFQARLPHIVLEGAPGQGKSTITQYVCQVHRMALLKKAEAQGKLPPEHSGGAPRLPIRIDLRDFATWLGKQDPFAGDEKREPPVGWRKSLESFIAALIGFHSGGTNFTTDDLVAVFKISSVLIVLDGLDEVADISRRHEVVEEIMKGVQRLEANAASLQTVITSRPAAFANSPGMPPDRYPYFHLASLTQSLINQYADKWLRARHIDGKEASDFRKTLKEKLEYPHLRDLARNPMQLTILLSLILTRGSSLPDKRTALYDNYVDLFFNRESEKSPVVREHRDLLIDIHRYLAWVLQSEAEQGTARGSISQERLQQTLANYLAREEQPTNLAKDLFTGMVERVVFLVSRVEGTFEFEVQPLREYFAARFLYETAPYSPPGKEQRGTKPDRFDALARNFYWTNVTRFYAGCFSKGELPALVERLEELANDEGFKTTTHPRMLACTLLADWVFSQNPKSVAKVVRLVLDGIGLRYLLASGGYVPRRHKTPWNPIALPPKCGREELVKRAFDILAGGPPLDYGFEIIELLRANVASVDEAVSAWRERIGPIMPRRWLEYGLRLGVLSRASLTEVAELIERQGDPEPPLNLLYRARRLDYLERDEQTFELSVAAILRREVRPQHQRRIESALDALSHALDPSRYATAFSNRVPVALAKVLAQQNRPEYLRWGPELATNTELYQSHRRCVAVAAVAQEESEKTAAEWATEISPWERIVETGRTEWGDRWAFSCLANLAAGIKSSSERCREFPDLLDHSLSLCRRTRHARLKSGQRMWWKGQFSAVRTPEDRMVASLVAMTWATPDTLVAIHENLNDALTKLDNQQWDQVFSSCRLSMALAHLRKEEMMASFDAHMLTEGLSARTVVALASRAAPETAHQLHKKFFGDKLDNASGVLEFVQGEALDVERFGTKDWKPDLQRIQRCYEYGALEPHLPVLIRRKLGSMPLAIARAIASEPAKYPSYLVTLADDSCTRSMARGAKGVADIAKREGWFGEPVALGLFES
jgi:hypothetical protein